MKRIWSKEVWCEFHKAFGHDVKHCITLGYQLADFQYVKSMILGRSHPLAKEVIVKNKCQKVAAPLLLEWS